DVTNFAFVVEEIDGRPVRDVVRRLDGTVSAAAVPPGTPRQLFLRDDFLHGFTTLVGLDTEEDDGLVGELLHKRPLVAAQGPAGPSPMAPEVEQQHLAAIVAQLELLAVNVLADNLRGGLIDLQVRQILDAIQLSGRLVAKLRFAVGS